MNTKKMILSMAGTLVLGIALGGTLMYNDSVYDSVKDAINGGATHNAVGDISGTNQVIPINVQSMDLETALMAVQSQRANLLEIQLQEQVKAVKERNELIAKLNQILSDVNVQLGLLPSDAKGDQAVTLSADLIAKLTGLNLSLPKTKAELEKVRDTLKGQIDASNNSQQMDMLRLQSLSNKRNEAFDVMTNFIKKMQDSRSSIIGNMR